MNKDIEKAVLTAKALTKGYDSLVADIPETQHDDLLLLANAALQKSVARLYSADYTVDAMDYNILQSWLDWDTDRDAYQTSVKESVTTRDDHPITDALIRLKYGTIAPASEFPSDMYFGDDAGPLINVGIESVAPGAMDWAAFLAVCLVSKKTRDPLDGNPKNPADYRLTGWMLLSSLEYTLMAMNQFRLIHNPPKATFSGVKIIDVDHEAFFTASDDVLTVTHQQPWINSPYLWPWLPLMFVHPTDVECGVVSPDFDGSVDAFLDMDAIADANGTINLLPIATIKGLVLAYHAQCAQLQTLIREKVDAGLLTIYIDRHETPPVTPPDLSALDLLVSDALEVLSDFMLTPLVHDCGLADERLPLATIAVNNLTMDADFTMARMLSLLETLKASMTPVE